MKALAVALTALALGLGGLGAQAVAADFYVDRAARPGGDGRSWATAFLQPYLAFAEARATPEVDTVHVAEGEYRDMYRFDGEDLRILGGYPTGGGPRDPLAHETRIYWQDLPTMKVRNVPRTFLLDGLSFYQNPVLPDFCPESAAGLVLVGSRFQVANCTMMLNSAGGPGAASIVLGNISESHPPVMVGTRILQNYGQHGFPPELCGVGGVYVTSGAPQSAPARITVMSHCLVSRNEAQGSWNDPTYAGGIAIGYPDPNLTLLFDHVLVRDNVCSGMLLAGNVELRSCEITGNYGFGVLAACHPATSVLMENCTIADNVLDAVGAGRPSDAMGPAQSRRIRLLRSIEWGNAGGTWQQDPAGCPVEQLVVEDSLVEGGWPGGFDVLAADPLFTAGPDGGYYLSQVAAGQATDSPAVDAGNFPSSVTGFAAETTRTDGVGDAGATDLGAHRVASGPMVIERGLTPRFLSATAYVIERRWTDYAGSLSMSTEPLVCYAVPSAGGTLRVSADRARDAVALLW